MRIVPVLDLTGGVVVRGVAGRRQEYRPLVSPLCPSAEPNAVADALHRNFGFMQFYIADLDAIAGKAPALALFQELQARGFGLWVDAGLHSRGDATPLIQAGVARLIAGLETLEGPEVLTALCSKFEPERIIFSLDLKGGQPLSKTAAWSTDDPRAIAEQAIARGIRSMIVLDLAHVGTGGGIGTEELCQHLTRDHPDIEVTAGGGIRGVQDLQRLQDIGVRNVLVASALHDGRLVCGEFWP